jgi:hypothetical protein
MPGMEDFKVDNAGLRAILRDQARYPDLEKAAVPILARAKALASFHHRTGRYEGSITTERVRNVGRVGIRVIADDPKASILEARYRILNRAVG